MYYDELDMEVVEEYTTEYSDAYCCLFWYWAREKPVVIGTVTCSWMYLYTANKYLLVPHEYHYHSQYVNQCQYYCRLPDGR